MSIKGEEDSKAAGGVVGYLGDGVQACSVLQQKFNDFDTILLASDVQRGEAVLLTRYTLHYQP